MQLKKLFQQLSFGELKDLSISNEGAGVIAENDIGSVITHINDTLTLLHTRYVLKQAVLNMSMEPGVLQYTVADENLIQILNISDVKGNDALINHMEVPGPRIIPPATFVFDLVPAVTTLNVRYQLNHPEIEFDLDPDIRLAQEIDIPRFLVEPVRAMIAHKVFAQMNSESAMVKGQEWFQKFTALCDLLENRGLLLVNVNFAEADKFHKFGWV